MTTTLRLALSGTMTITRAIIRLIATCSGTTFTTTRPRPMIRLTKMKLMITTPKPLLRLMP